MFSKHYKSEDFNERYRELKAEEVRLKALIVPSQLIDPEANCATCIFKFQNMCKCCSSNHYNKETPEEACDYYLKDDVDKLSIEESEEES